MNALEIYKVGQEIDTKYDTFVIVKVTKARIAYLRYDLGKQGRPAKGCLGLNQFQKLTANK